MREASYKGFPSHFHFSTLMKLQCDFARGKKSDYYTAILEEAIPYSPCESVNFVSSAASCSE